jgi:hypothetical protein
MLRFTHQIEQLVRSRQDKDRPSTINDRALVHHKLQVPED